MIYLGMILQNRFLVGQRLGSGGFAETFDVSDRGTPKLLKVLKIPPAIDEDYRKAVSLFQREAEVLRHLHHPGIPRVEPDGYFTVELDRATEPYHCLVMEKIAGQNLEEWLSDNGVLSWELAIDWLNQLLEILDKLHQKQFFHRDIKPSNIMLKPDGKLVLIDFGAVREVSNTYLAKIGSRKEVTGLISPGYTPIEQVYGKAVPQSDFFALGCTFVHLLTGQHPIDIEEDANSGLLKWRSAIPHSKKRTHPKFVKFANLIDRLIEKFAGNRPKTVGEILQELETLDLPDSRNCWVQPLTTLKAEGWTAPLQFLRKRVKAIASGVAIASLGWWIFAPEIAFELNEVGHELNEVGYQEMDDGKLQQAELYLRISLLFDPKFGAARYNLGLVCKRLEKYECADKQYRLAAADPTDRVRAAALNNLGHLLLLLNQDVDEAIQYFSQGLKRVEEIAVKSNLNKNAGWAYFLKADYAKAEEHLQEAIALNPDNGEAYCILASVLAARGDRPNALLQQQRCQQSDFEDKENWIQIASHPLDSN